MASVIIGSWQDRLIDNRNADQRSIEDTFPQLDGFEEGNQIRAFVGWDGFSIFVPTLHGVQYPQLSSWTFST